MVMLELSLAIFVRDIISLDVADSSPAVTCELGERTTRSQREREREEKTPSLTAPSHDDDDDEDSVSMRANVLLTFTPAMPSGAIDISLLLRDSEYPREYRKSDR
jgi:hypothetical protein